MNGFERINNIFLGKPVDRTPKMLHNFMMAAEENKYSMGEFRKDPKKIAKAFIDISRKYELDGILIDVDTAIEAHAMGAIVDFPEDEPARVIGPAGKRAEEIIACLEPGKLLKDERVNHVLEAITLIRQEVGGELFIRGNADQGPFSLGMLCYGMQDFMMALVDEDEEENLFKILDRAYEVHLAYHKLIKQAGADITSFGDSSCGPDLISREMYLKFAYPYHRRLVKDLGRENIQTVCHICGNLNNIMADVVNVGFAGVEIDYKTNLEEAYKLMYGKSILFGPIDPSGVFCLGTTKLVEEKTREVLEVCHKGGIVIGAGCALPPHTPAQNVEAFCRIVNKMNNN